MKISFKDIESNTKPSKVYDPGVYEVQVIKAEEGQSKSGTPYLLVEFETKGDETFKVKHWFYQTPKALSILLNFLDAIGIYDKSNKEDLEYSAEELLGAILQVEFVKDSDDKYLVLKPWSCKAASGLATPKKNDEVEEMPF